MKNGYKLFWTGNAKSELKDITDYIENNWNETAIKKFFRKLEKNLEILQSAPFSYPESSVKKQIRRMVISKQTTIYYKVLENEIVILSV